MHTPSDTVSIGGRAAGPGAPVVVVAEAGSNHDGKLSQARELVRAAADAGADAVKFQLFRKDGLYPAGEEPSDEHLLRDAWLGELAEEARRQDILFLCSVFDDDTLAALEAHEPPAVKIASPESNHLPLLAHAARLGVPLLVSTGLCTLADVAEAVDATAGAGIVLLQCVSSYPAPAEESNLAVLDLYRRAFGVPAGLSDHTADVERTPAIASAAGAVLIEKHITLDRSLPGPDHGYSLEPNELARLVRVLRKLDELELPERTAWVREEYGEADVRRILGSGRKEVQPSERDLYPHDKRSIHAVRDIAADEPLSPANVAILRSGERVEPGLHPRYWDVVCGAVAARAVKSREGVRWEDLIRRDEPAVA
jgi:sialic acid synthase SpsE